MGLLISRLSSEPHIGYRDYKQFFFLESGCKRARGRETESKSQEGQSGGRGGKGEKERKERRGEETEIEKQGSPEAGLLFT